MTTRLITAEELIAQPIGFDWSDTAESIGASGAIEAVEQLRVIEKASAWASKYCFGNIGRLDATTDTETARLAPAMQKAFVDNQGWLWMRTDYFPILSVSSAQWAIATAGVGTPTFNALDTTKLQIYGEGFRLQRIADLSQDWTWLRWGSLLKWTYVNGWPNAVLTADMPTQSYPASVNVAVDTSLGMTVTTGAIGNLLEIYDGAQSEIVTVTAVPDATHVTATFQYQHFIGVGLSSLPPDVKLGVAFACLHFARQRGTDAVTFVGGGGAPAPSKPGVEGDALAEAEVLLDDYRRRV